MTAEIAVLNREAAALAADSAVTLRLPEGNKIYQTNKLFALSKYEPVGVMVYGNAGFMSLPWETIIKNYRAQLGRANFSQLASYGSDFLLYLENSSHLSSAASQDEFCYQFTRSWLRRLKIRLHKKLKTLGSPGGNVTLREFRSSFAQILTEDKQHLQNHRRLQRLSRIPTTSLLRRYSSTISRAINDELEEFAKLVRKRDVQVGCIQALVKDLYWNNESGVVLAGFGSGQVLPSLRCFTVDGIVAGRLRAQEELERGFDVTNDNSACVRAFAQSEMVGLFMNGFDAGFAEYLGDFIARSFVEEYPGLLDRLLQAHLSKSARSDLAKKLRALGKEIVSEYEKAFSDYSRNNHWWPVVEIVNFLPKEELAAMAEALVNLTSFKRHITKQAETVGGPIDVAVISRGDGLIWIKRKHYFSKDLNQHFLSNYYNDTRRPGVQNAKKSRFFKQEGR